LVLEAQCEECFDKLLEDLNFLHTEFLRVVAEREIQTEDLTQALAGLDVSAIDSLKAAMLLVRYDDMQDADALIQRFEEHFTLMIYFSLCDDGEALKSWFSDPNLVVSGENDKIRTAVDSRIATLFSHNPGWSFRDRFDEASRASVHATWCLAWDRLGRRQVWPRHA
jgi:hypothetical protein